jgi:hypothetical protein
MTILRRCAGIALALTFVLAGCATRVEPLPGGSPAAPGRTDPTVAGALVIEQFLRAVNAQDFDTMARLFGTKQGPVVKLYDRQQVEDRMFALAGILKHDDYKIRGTEVVPGRRDEASRIIVQMSVRGRQVDVPYTLVWSDDRTWLIEQIDLEKVTGR